MRELLKLHLVHVAYYEHSHISEGLPFRTLCGINLAGKDPTIPTTKEATCRRCLTLESRAKQPRSAARSVGNRQR